MNCVIKLKENLHVGINYVLPGGKFSPIFAQIKNKELCDNYTSKYPKSYDSKKLDELFENIQKGEVQTKTENGTKEKLCMKFFIR